MSGALAVALLVELVGLLPVAQRKFLLSRAGRRAYGVRMARAQAAVARQQREYDRAAAEIAGVIEANNNAIAALRQQLAKLKAQGKVNQDN